LGFHIDSSCLVESGELERALDELAEVGGRRAIIPWWDPERLRTPADVEELAQRLNGAGEAVARRGMELGYHNHWWEFARRIEGKTLHDWLFARLHPAIFAEVDVYWAAVGGCDPAGVLRGLGSRAKLLHLKDGPADGEDSLKTALGEGVLDLPGIVRAADPAAGAIVEIDDCAGDVYAALARSAAYLRGLAARGQETPGGPQGAPGVS
jgi:sugar phosphate isomerase/epimerase